jgi:hypothetical protein
MARKEAANKQNAEKTAPFHISLSHSSTDTSGSNAAKTPPFGVCPAVDVDCYRAT